MTQLIQKIDFLKIEEYLQAYFDNIIAPKIGIHSSIRQLLLSVGVLSTATYIISKYIIYRNFLHPVNKIPGPKVEWFPFTGNMLEIIREDAGVPHKRWKEKYGGIVSYKGPWYENRILVTDPEYIKHIITTNSYDYVKPPRTVEFLRKVLGNGVLVAEGDIHKKQRKMLNPAFSIQAIREMVHLMMIPGVQLRNAWLDEVKKYNNSIHADNQPTEIIVSNGLSLATLDVIGETGFGYSFDSLKTVHTPEQNKLGLAYSSIFNGDISFMRFLQFFFPILQYLPTQRNLDLKRDLKWLDEESRKLVENGLERVKQGNSNNEINKDDDGNDGFSQKNKRSKDLLTLMANETDDETGKKMTIKELQDQCLTFLAAGHETTSVSLSWTLWYLAKNQDAQSALRDEIKPLFDAIDMDHPLFTNPSQVDHAKSIVEANIPKYDDINKLPLLNNVCKEALRLSTPVPTTNRLATKDDVIGPYFIPKGTNVFFSIITSHHDKKVWGEDALEFNPDRWNHAPAKNVSPYEYAPFLYPGARTCIGNRFAMMEMKVLLAILIKDMKFTEKKVLFPNQNNKLHYDLHQI
ncbi:unnamed protein product [Cunninghamella blakesleeana]